MDFLDKMSSTAAKSAKIMAKKSSELIEVGKLNLSMQKKHDQILEKYEQIGQYVYSRLKRRSFVTKEELSQWIHEIEMIEAEIESYEKLVMNIKNVKYCEACKLELDEDNRYCPFCGKYISS